jgi:hypothetical protein
MEDLTNHLIPYEVIHEREVEQTHERETTDGEHPVTEVLESGRIPQQITRVQEDADDDLLDKEKDNATNSSILEPNTITVFVRKRVGDSRDVSRLAEDCEWVDMPLLEIPTRDPYNSVGRRMRMLWAAKKLRPHDSNLRRLEYEDCYKAAKADVNNTLYMMAASPQTDEEMAIESTLIQPPSMALEVPSLMGPSPQIDEDMAIESTMSLFQPPSMALEVPSSMGPSPQTEEEIAVGSTLLTHPPSIPPEMSHWHPLSRLDEQFH